MIETDALEIWNLSRGGVARSGAVDIFNIVGRLRDPQAVRGLDYALNGGSRKPVYHQQQPSRSTRLWHVGEFNIDTIALGDLREENRLQLFVTTAEGEKVETVDFRARPFAKGPPSFSLDLDGVRHPEEVGQIVEGPWTVGETADGDRCLRVAPAQAGYDRIILFGRHDWTSGYEIDARLRITAVTGRHNIGLIFKWNPHERGDGTRLPQKWSSGLGYYCSYARQPGLRIRYGVGVHVDVTGVKHGDHVLAEAPFRPVGQPLVERIRRKAGLFRGASDLVVGQDYRFRMTVDPHELRLTVWEAERPEPRPQVEVVDAAELLDSGAVGILAYQVGVDLSAFDVLPLRR